MEDIQTIRCIETIVISSAKNVNDILKIKRFLIHSSVDVRLGAIHSLRRIFVHYIEDGLLGFKIRQETPQLLEFRKWMLTQFNHFFNTLCEFISRTEEDVTLQAVCIRTLIEFVRRDGLLSKTASNQFGVSNYRKIFESLLKSANIDADILIMMREEIFNLLDCAYYALLCLRNSMLSLRRAEDTEELPVTRAVSNTLDLLRMIAPPSVDEVTSRALLVDQTAVTNVYDIADGFSSDNEGDSEDSEHNEATLNRKKKKTSKKNIENGPKDTKKRKRLLSRAEQFRDITSHKKAFRKCWLALLSMPQLTLAQHKIILKHLPDYVLQEVDQPLLLADYLTSSYGYGGAVAILALESLFQLIVSHNLDYPDFFLSLYCLCTAEVFSAKYRGKYMRLLSTSLKSTNLPAYLIAAFAKRLARLAMHTPSPCALFCVAQITWLLKQHPQCITLLHSTVPSSAPSAVDFNNEEETNLENAGALSSSLWELLVLQKHHLHQVGSLSSALETAASTAAGAGSTLMVVDDFIDHSYSDIIEAELKAIKTGVVPLAFNEPSGLLSLVNGLPDDQGGIIAQCFGM